MTERNPLQCYGRVSSLSEVADLAPGSPGQVREMVWTLTPNFGADISLYFPVRARGMR